MKFHLLTLFPEVIHPYLSTSIIGRAKATGVIDVNVVDPRAFTQNIHKKVDDSPYGGGSGMVLSCQPIDDAFQSLLPLSDPYRVLITSPAGKVFNHDYAVELSQLEEIVILCGHYEGFDERILELLPQAEEVSVGDFVLTGGELPALCILDAVTRFLPGAVQKYSSVEADSFVNQKLDHPHYTRPASYKGFSVPEVLMSGNHKAIEIWRKKASLLKTWQNRPDLLSQIILTNEEKEWLRLFEKGLPEV